MTSKTIKHKTALRQMNSISSGKPPHVIGFFRNSREYKEVEPDAWDRALLNEAEGENDGSTISLEQLSGDLGIAL